MNFLEIKRYLGQNTVLEFIFVLVAYLYFIISRLDLAMAGYF